jgi:F-type H+-transporting ATPase subunit gamma
MPRSRQLVPVSLEALKAVVEDIVPSHGKFASLSAVSATHVPDYTIEPDTHSVLDTLMPQLLNTMLFHMMLESKASEHSARMVAMKNASDKASNMSRELSLQYNKERQAVITREVSEITGGIEAMSEQ